MKSYCGITTVLLETFQSQRDFTADKYSTLSQQSSPTTFVFFRVCQRSGRSDSLQLLKTKKGNIQDTLAERLG